METNNQQQPETTVDDIADFAEFLRGYISALGFTARGENVDQEDEYRQPLEIESPFGHFPGCSFDDCVDMSEELDDRLPRADHEELEQDARDFFNQAAPMISGREYTAGVDFHFTRNGHGAGFWDGDWTEFGDKLTELSKPYGTLELIAIFRGEDNETICEFYLVH